MVARTDHPNITRKPQSIAIAGELRGSTSFFFAL